MNKNVIRKVSAVGLAALLAACGGEQEEPGTTIVIDAAQLVKFPADASLVQIQHVATAATGEIWVLQRTAEPHVLIYSSEGALLNSFGPTGPALRQMSNPLWLLPGYYAGQPMSVWDAGNRRVIKFGEDANPVDQHPVQRSRAAVYAPIEEHSYGRPLQMARFGEGYLLEDHPTDLATTGDYLRSKLLQLDAIGNRVTYLMDFGNEFSDGIRTLGQFADLLVPIPLWTTCSAEEFVLFNPFAGTVQFFGLDGTMLASDSVPVERRRVTEDDQRRYLKREMELRWLDEHPGEPMDPTVIENSIDYFLLHYLNRFTEYGPAAVDMMCGADRQVWLDEFSTVDHALGYGHRWVVHKPGQTEILRVQFPAGFRPWEVSQEGRVLGAYQDGSGSPVVAYVELPPLEPTPGNPAG